ncbi:NADH:ubiquinone oxidoreductase subunit 4 (chain M) [Protaetiibacter sp. SSC-01]|uniref:NADH:ubiquinone oxidoreductase subunit 4 (chain M) n=1 Tax=Protaetiibacter sp. SSC-01 TaxID=2759943 RepID=UPI001656A1C8|nr:NADH:ubiquinone oxidoreductase subunit 4 (chain M) [Protaetiibacter sp. SSC-01]QNO38566.1 NADH:ubiquinone oxidoreductase subunit 4 (chain M) [Protaetiibacter sp. SSC-01]
MQRLLWIVIGSAVLVGALVSGAIVWVTGWDPGTATGSDRAPSAVAVEDDEDWGTVEVYEVDDAGRLSPDAGGLTAEIWELFTRIATPEATSASLVQFRVGDAPDSDTLAYVYQDESDPSLWILAANLATSEDRTDLIATLVHEYAHILSLAVDELDPAGECPDEQRLWEGCPLPGSVLEAFRAEFWAGYGDEIPGEDQDEIDAFYEAYEDDFVSDYAASNVVEDFAETFMTWVVEDVTEGSGTVADKFAFLDGVPWLVEERDRIRVELAEELGLAA